jgi:hypothetical protein
MWEDHIVETRAAREKLIHEFGEDLDYLQQVQREYQDRVVTGAETAGHRPPQSLVAAKANQRALPISARDMTPGERKRYVRK